MRQTTALPAGTRSDAAERLFWAPTTLFEGLRQAMRRRQIFLRTCRELEACTDRQLEDMGISRYDIRSIAREAAALADVG